MATMKSNLDMMGNFNIHPWISWHMRDWAHKTRKINKLKIPCTVVGGGDKTPLVVRTDWSIGHQNRTK